MQAGLDAGDVVVGDPLEQARGFCPRLLGGVTRDDVQANAEPNLPAFVGRELAHLLDLVADCGRRLAPGQVDVCVPRSDLECLR